MNTGCVAAPADLPGWMREKDTVADPQEIILSLEKAVGPGHMEGGYD